MEAILVSSILFPGGTAIARRPIRQLRKKTPESRQNRAEIGPQNVMNLGCGYPLHISVCHLQTGQIQWLDCLEPSLYLFDAPGLRVMLWLV
jgi:hypothetical protein